MKVVAIDYPGYGPWDLEAQTAGRIGAAFEVMAYEDFRERPRTCDMIINGGGWPLPMELLQRTGGCRFVLGFGTGVDWIDLEAAAHHGILVANTPMANVEDVATHALALILACARRVVELDARVRSGHFDSAGIPLMDRLDSKRLGLLSFGNVARRLSELARPLGLSMAAHDPFVSEELMRSYGVEPMSLENLLGTADILSVHTPATEVTRGLLNEERLRLLPAAAIVVITSRGAVYDSKALALLMHEGHIASAGLDVYPVEPIPDADPLLRIPTTVLTPHAAGNSQQAIDAYHEAAAAALLALDGGQVPDGTLNAATDGP